MSSLNLPALEPRSGGPRHRALLPARSADESTSVAWTPSALFEGQAAFEEVMTFAGRVTIASLLSYLVSQTFDVWAFHYIKARTGEAKLWLRNNGSTVVSQGIDTLIFYGIAFLSDSVRGTHPTHATGLRPQNCDSAVRHALCLCSNLVCAPWRQLARGSMIS